MTRTLFGFLPLAAAFAATAALAQPATKAPAAGPDNTPGWRMMDDKERRAHHEKMRGMKDHGECMKYMDQHHKRMHERAKERKAEAPGPMHQGCDHLKK